MTAKTAVSPALIALGQKLADASGEVIRRYYRAAFAIDTKTDESPVTIADRETEQAIRRLLEKERPQDGIHGEEFGSSAGSSGFLWVIDPIDGTKAFATGRPTFGTLIGLYQDGAPVLGIINQPINNERWLGAAGHGTTLNGKPVRCRPCPDLGKAVLSTTGPDMFDTKDYLTFNDKLSRKSTFTIYGGDCYCYGQLSSGWLDGVIESRMKLHDFAALIPVVEGAGGKITDWQGKPLRLQPEAKVVASGDARLHEQLCAVLAG